MGSKVIISDLFLQILSKNGWGEFKPQKDLVEATAIEFKEEDSFFLAGPFTYENKDYGLVHIYKLSKLVSETEMLEKLHKQVMTKESLTWMPYYLQKRIETLLGNSSEYWHDPLNKSTCYSALDLKHGIIHSEVRNRLVNRGKCGLFFKTEGALKEVLSYLSYEEAKEWTDALEKVANDICREAKLTQSTKENPYRVYLYGTDDSSFTAVCETLEQVHKLLEQIAKGGSEVVYKSMTFTN